jgi:rod shape-determining protein MreC
MVLDHRNGHLEELRNGLSVLVYPLRVAVDFPFSATRWADENLRERATLVAENEALRDAQLDTRAQLQRLAALEAENARLRALLDSSAKVTDRVLVSEIMSVDLDRFHHRILIDKGTHHGAFRGQALLSADGIVGQITRAEPFTSEAILISDPSHALPVEVNRNGLRAIAVGSGDLTRLSLPFLPNNADVEVGDLLVSSGLGGSFPAGYPVGIVRSIERDPGEPFATVTAEPAAALNRTREVLLVWSGKPPEGDDGSDSQQLAEGKP